LRIYYNVITGGLGGLVGWALITIFLRFSIESTAMLLLKDALLGAIVGGCIGAAVGASEQMAGSFSVYKARREILVSGGIGLAAGLIGLVIGEIVFLMAGGGVWPRAVGWAIFGALLGAGQWRVTGMKSKGIYGGLGGLLGGLIGGSTYERLSLLLRSLGLGRDVALTIGGAVGLIILGACIGLLMGLVEDILRTAWLRFVNGPLEGQTRTIDPIKPTVLGRSDGCTITLSRDPDIAPVHAEIQPQGQTYVILSKDGSVLLRTDNQQRQVQRYDLQPGDMVQLGRTRFVFQTDESGVT